MKAGINYVIVKLEKLTNDTIQSNIVDKNGNNVELHLDTSYKELEHTKIDATVISVGDLKGGEVIHKQIGFPKPNPEKDRTPLGVARDRLGTQRKPYEYLPYSACKIDIQAGDRIYFHYNQINKTNYIDTIDKVHYYRIMVEKVFCVVRDGVIIPQLGHVMVEPYYDTEVEDIDYQLNGQTVSIKGVINKRTNLVEEIDSKPKYLLGKVKHFGESIGFSSSPHDFMFMDFCEGIIIYTPNSEFKNTIEGQEYYIMKQWDIVAYYDEDIDKWMSFRNYVKVLPDKPDEEVNGIKIVNPKKKDSGIVTGDELDEIGSLAGIELDFGSRIHFHRDPNRCIEPEGLKEIFVQIEDILYVES